MTKKKKEKRKVDHVISGLQIRPERLINSVKLNIHLSINLETPDAKYVQCNFKKTNRQLSKRSFT